RNHCRTEYGVDIPAVDFVRDLTVAQIAARVDHQPAEAAIDADAPVASSSAGESPLFPVSAGQRALWYLHQVQRDSAAYNIALALRVRSGVDEAAFRSAIDGLTARHRQLRTVFRETEAGV